MRPEITVILVCLGLAVVCAVFCYCCLVVAGDADQKQEEAAEKMKKRKQNDLCVKNLYLPDGKGGFEEVKTMRPKDIKTDGIVRPPDGLSVSERTVLEKKAEEKHGNKD